ncbi:MAG TPA: hypothetical protein VLX29_05345 [Nitrospirota bacterium]|nr:hypothetical protein [Nitrospirota bacterium]
MAEPQENAFVAELKTAAAQKEYERFKAAYQLQLERARATVALSILVWGPGKGSTSPVGPKRRDIYDALMNLGHNAMTSEELAGEAFACAFSEAAKEFAQAQEAHLIIVLIEEAPGAQGEVHEFASNPDLAQKFYIFVPKKYQHGYSAKGIIKDLDEGWHNVYWYDDEEVTACNLLKESIKCAEARRQVEYRRRRVRV